MTNLTSRGKVVYLIWSLNQPSMQTKGVYMRLVILLFYHFLQQFYAFLFFKSTAYCKTAFNKAEKKFIPYVHPHKKPLWLKEKILYL